MKQAIESSDTKALRKVLSEININISAIRSNAKNFVSNAIVAGQLLSKIKGATKYGDWGGFLESVELTHNTAARYMRLWENRSAIDLKTVKSLSVAEAMIAQLCESVSECQGIDKPTSQNEPLTHEKTIDSEVEKRSGLGTDSGNTGTARRDAKGADPKTRPSSFDPDKIPRNNMGAYVSGPEALKPEKNGAPEIRRDKTGCPIPKELLPEWDRATNQANGWIRAFDDVHRQVMGAYGQDFAVAHISKETIESLHSNYRQNLKQALPYAVCDACQGKLPEHCKRCNPEPKNKNSKGLGWLNKHFYDDCVPKEHQQMRHKLYGTYAPAGLPA